jgi:hypothetical protein
LLLILYISKDISCRKLYLQPEKEGFSFRKICPFLCFQMFHKAMITTSMKKGFAKSFLGAKAAA